ncbi:hypothetical protein HDU67_006816 [Dinochytrium kinnereticum]|nr:hypothetical protein HDU67_006816 [Dinochytrium kinnereticum]
MKTFTVTSAAAIILAAASSVSSQTPNTVSTYTANCGDNQATFDLCIKNALTEPNLVSYSDVPSLCVTEAFSQVASYACMCKGYRKVSVCFVNSCPNDPLFTTIKAAETSNCDGAIQLGATSLIPVTATATSAVSTASVAATTSGVANTGSVSPTNTTSTQRNSGLSTDSRTAAIFSVGAATIGIMMLANAIL